MSIEADIVSLVGALCSGRIYPDVAPVGVATPFVTYQQVGGEVINIIKGPVDYGQARIQFNVWSTTRSEANTLMRSIEAALRPPNLNGRPTGALIARYEEITKLRGAQQDFEFWWP